MVSVQYANAMAETLHYLKGIRKEDVDRIPKKFMNFLEENASKDFVCDFDYTKPLNELNVQKETKGLIGYICLNCWCITDKQKEDFISKLKENERKYQEELRKKYNPDDIFKDSNQTYSVPKNLALEVRKESIFTRVKNWFKNLFSR